MPDQTPFANKAVAWERARKPSCDAKIRVMIINFWCTRRRGHKGRHQMNGSEPGLIYYTWRRK